MPNLFSGGTPFWVVLRLHCKTLAPKIRTYNQLQLDKGSEGTVLSRQNMP